MCTITLNQPTVVLSGNTITSISVTGAIGPIGDCPCDLLDITIRCSNLPPTALLSPPKHSVQIDWNTGTFSTVFTGAEIANCYCEKGITIVAQCGESGPSVTQTFTIDCGPCNDLTITNLPNEVCENDLVQFQVAYTGGGTANLFVNFGDGSSPQPLNNVGASGVTVTHTYGTAGTYTIIITVNEKRCEFKIVVKKCNCCPNATALVTSDIKEACNKDLTKSVTVTAVITPTPQTGCPTTIQAEMYIDNTLASSGSGSSPFTLTHSGDYDCGDHIVTIKYPGSGCPDSGSMFCVSVCETKKCIKRRLSFNVAATVSLISLFLYIFNSAYTILAGLFTGFLIAAIIYYFRWRPCDQRCKKCPCMLATWQIALATFVGFIMLSKSSFITLYGWLLAAFSFAGTFAPVLAVLIIIILILLVILIIYLLYNRWVGQCCPTECEKWTNIKDAFLDVCAIAFAIVGGVILASYGAGVAALFWIPYATIVWALVAWWVKLKKIEACGL